MSTHISANFIESDKIKKVPFALILILILIPNLIYAFNYYFSSNTILQISYKKHFFEENDVFSHKIEFPYQCRKTLS